MGIILCILILISDRFIIKQKNAVIINIICTFVHNNADRRCLLNDSNRKETTAIEDLKTQEQACIEKYTKYSNQAKDPVLKELFEEIARDEQKHFDSLDQVIKGKVPSVDCNDSKGKNYNPAATYDSLGNSEDKKADCYLATDCIGTEKLVSGEYNSDVFVFGNSDIRKLLADIQIEEQNHAEMLWKYKTANGMA